MCGSDLHVLDGDYLAVRCAVIPGHEFPGTIVALALALGREIRNVAIGDRVAVDPMIYCGGCTECRRGTTNLCWRGGGLGRTVDGALAKLVAVRAAQCEVLPETLPADWAPITEPLSCVIHAMDRIGTVLGDRVLAIGAGAAGLLMSGTLAIAGAVVDVVERNAERRELAIAFGARSTAADLGALATPGDGWDHVVDASGSPEAIPLGLGHLHRGGRLCIFGVAPTSTRVVFSPSDNVLARALDHWDDLGPQQLPSCRGASRLEDLPDRPSRHRSAPPRRERARAGAGPGGNRREESRRPAIGPRHPPRRKAMNAIVYAAPLDFSLVEVEGPTPGWGEVRMRGRMAGMCVTDVHLHAGEFFPVYPLTPGHEIVGEVDLLGEGVNGLVPGDLVALDNMISCGLCEVCRRGRPAYCRTLRALGVTDRGGFAELVVAPGGKCHSAGNLVPDIAVFAEPTACAIHGLDVLDPQLGSDVLVFGAGPSGMRPAVAPHRGARVTVAAPTAFKLELARSFGIDEVILVDRYDPSAAVTSLRALAPEGFDIVVDATGATAMLEQCLALTRDRGALFVYSMAGKDTILGVHPYEVFRRELTIKGSFSQSFSVDRAMLALSTRRVRTDGLVTHRFGLGDFARAITTVADDHTRLKAVIEM